MKSFWQLPPGYELSRLKVLGLINQANVCLSDYQSDYQAIKALKREVGINRYREVASSNTSRLEAHAGFFRMLMKGIFNPYVL